MPAPPPSPSDRAFRVYCPRDGTQGPPLPCGEFFAVACCRYRAACNCRACCVHDCPRSR